MKRAQTSTSAAVLVIIIGLVLVVYVMSLPPTDREALLNSNTIPSDSASKGSVAGLESRGIDTSFSFSGPGFVDDTDDENIYELPAVQLRTRVNSQILAEDPLFYITNSFSKEQNRVLSFGIEDLDETKNVKLSFLAKTHTGVLTVSVNNRVVLQQDLDKQNIVPIALPQTLLQKNNIVEFSVDGVGLLFWRKNEYIIEDFKVFGDVTDLSEQSSEITFELKPSEFKFLEQATLDFYPDCDQLDVGKLRISINGRSVFYQTPDCKVLNKYDLPYSSIKEGFNTLSFQTDKDSYLIDRIELETKLEENDDLIYYFDLDKELFSETYDEEFVCGEIDGYCPENCEEDVDKDCCFIEYSTKSYWCDVPTVNQDYRCVGRVDVFNFADCPSGYEDRNGNPHDDFEGVCGDDTDNFCPEGCSRFYDQDCCLVDNSGNFWCDDLPIGGVEYTCLGSVSNDQATFCPSGYEGEEYDPDNLYNSRNDEVKEVTLKSTYDVELTITFVDSNERKRGIITVNGREMSFSTLEDEVVRTIDDFVEDGTNYVQIIPDNAFNLVKVDIDVVEE